MASLADGYYLYTLTLYTGKVIENPISSFKQFNFAWYIAFRMVKAINHKYPIQNNKWLVIK